MYVAHKMYSKLCTYIYYTYYTTVHIIHYIIYLYTLYTLYTILYYILYFIHLHILHYYIYYVHIYMYRLYLCVCIYMLAKLHNFNIKSQIQSHMQSRRSIQIRRACSPSASSASIPRQECCRSLQTTVGLMWISKENEKEKAKPVGESYQEPQHVSSGSLEPIYMYTEFSYVCFLGYKDKVTHTCFLHVTSTRTCRPLPAWLQAVYTQQCHTCNTYIHSRV